MASDSRSDSKAVLQRVITETVFVLCIPALKEQTSTDEVTDRESTP